MSRFESRAIVRVEPWGGSLISEALQAHVEGLFLIFQAKPVSRFARTQLLLFSLSRGSDKGGRDK